MQPLTYIFVAFTLGNHSSCIYYEKINSYIPLWHGIILLLYPGVKERGTAMNKNKHLLSDERIRIEELLK